MAQSRLGRWQDRGHGVTEMYASKLARAFTESIAIRAFTASAATMGGDSFFLSIWSRLSTTCSFF